MSAKRIKKRQNNVVISFKVQRGIRESDECKGNEIFAKMPNDYINLNQMYFFLKRGNCPKSWALDFCDFFCLKFLNVGSLKTNSFNLIGKYPEYKQDRPGKLIQTSISVFPRHESGRITGKLILTNAFSRKKLLDRFRDVLRTVLVENLSESGRVFQYNGRVYDSIFYQNWMGTHKIRMDEFIRKTVLLTTP